MIRIGSKLWIASVVLLLFFLCPMLGSEVPEASQAATAKTSASPKTPTKKAPAKPLAASAKISMKQARAVALKKASGKIESEELEREHGRLVYSFDIRISDGRISEVQVSAINGKVVSVQHETAEQEAKEAQKENHKKKEK